MSSKAFWALTCSLISFSGFIFLFLVGILVQIQPEYLKINKNGSSPATSIFESACLYGTLFVVSFTIYYKETKKNVPRNYDLSGSTLEERQSLLDKSMMMRSYS
ncbi:unnamed protein product [Peronospora belbahrii]|uniref:Uncharacterized protein n=1 Tax=Peronospora belbahrii TaxID=622444 RepID=A0ABN8CUR0_9STRA|nr:unnamed protein product [Peronospora belbahrii]